MSLTLVAAGEWHAGAELLPLKHASVNGRQLYSLAHHWSGLLKKDRIIGIYQALGQEKMQANRPAIEVLLKVRPEDELKPVATILTCSAYGPFVSLAISEQCLGPFFSLEADELAGALAVTTALADLAEGRCAQALVGSYAGPDSTWLSLFEANPHRDGPSLRWHCRYSSGREQVRADDFQALAEALGCELTLAASPDRASDPHGSRAMQQALLAAQSGVPTAVFCCTGDRRGLLVGFAQQRSPQGN